MAVGDIINAVATTTGTFTYQPAVGVEIIITSMHFYDENAQEVGITDGTRRATFTDKDSGSWGDWAYNNMNTKIGITNTNYLTLTGGSGTRTPGFTGIQTK